jgi:hypothetical protein
LISHQDPKPRKRKISDLQNNRTSQRRSQEENDDENETEASDEDTVID